MTTFAVRAEPLLKDDFSYASDAQEILAKNLTPQITALKERLSKIEKFDKTIIEAEFRATAALLGLKVKELVHPVRVALTGQRVGAGLFETMEVLGKERVLKRLARLCDYWQQKEEL
jgi:glutamyl/glutaminyl-tRNA synthetase